VIYTQYHSFNPSNTQDLIHAALPNIYTSKLFLYTPKVPTDSFFCYCSDT